MNNENSIQRYNPIAKNAISEREQLLLDQEQQLVDDFFSCSGYGFARKEKVLPEALENFRERMKRTDSIESFVQLYQPNQIQRLLRIYQYSAQSQTQRPDLYPVEDPNNPQVFRMEYRPSPEIEDSSVVRYDPVVLAVWNTGADRAVAMIDESVLQINNVIESPSPQVE